MRGKLGKSTAIGLAGLLGLSSILLALAGSAVAAPPPSPWSSPVQFEEQATNGYTPAGAVLARAPDGAILAAWAEYTADTGNQHVYFRMFDPASGWGAASTVTSYCGGEANQPSVAAFPNGSFILAYRDSGSGCGASYAAVFALRFDTAHGGWQPAETVSTDAGYADVQSPLVKTDGNGDAFVAYTTYDGANTDMHATRWTPSGGWPATTALLENTTYAASNPSLAVDGAGNAIAIWRQSDGTSSSIFANRYVGGSGWGAATQLDASTSIAYTPVLAMDGSGNAEALWVQGNGTVNNLLAARFAAGTGWGAPSVLNGWTTYGVSNPSVAWISGGTIVAAWHQGNATGISNIFSSTFNGTSWGNATDITTDALPQGAVAPAVVADGSGSAVVFYLQFTPAYNWHIWTKWWSPAAGWTAGGQFDANPLYYATFSAALFDGAGHGLALFLQNDGTVVHLFASMYTRPDTTAPTLTASAPATTTTPTVVVNGTTEAGATVTVGGLAATVAADGTFSVLVALDAGANTLVVVATDASGNAASQTLTVTFDDPVPGLQTQLATANNNLAATQAQLAGAQADLVTARQALNQTKTDQAATDFGQQAKIDAAAASAGTAMLVGLLGLIVGLAGIGMGFMMSRKSMGAGTPAEPAAPKAAEPPK